MASVRTQPRRVRTPEEVTDSLFRAVPKEKQPQPRQKPPRPAEHKRVWADLLASKDEVIAAVAAEVKRTDPQGVKTHVALCDGERALQRRIVPALLGVVPAVILILDLLHVLEKMWLVAHCFYAEGSEAEATAWMREQTLRVLQGGRGRGDRGMRRRATMLGLSGQKRGTVDEVAAYLEQEQAEHELRLIPAAGVADSRRVRGRRVQEPDQGSHGTQRDALGTFGRAGDDTAALAATSAATWTNIGTSTRERSGYASTLPDAGNSSKSSHTHWKSVLRLATRARMRVWLDRICC